MWVLSLAAAALVGSVSAVAEEPWQPAGLGGMGGMFAMAVSPVDPQQMMVNCDMSGAYVTHDGGRTWHMIHHKQLGGNTRCSPAYHPMIANRVYAVNGNNELRVSDDAGATWRPVLDGKAPWKGPIDFLGLVAAPCEYAQLVGVDGGAYLVYERVAQHCEGVRGGVVGTHLLMRQDTEGRPREAHVVIATTGGILRTPDLIKRGAGMAEGYAPYGSGLPKGTITSFSAGVKGDVRRLYATVECSLVDGKLTGGVYTSADDGTTWQSCMHGGLNVETHRSSPFAQGDIPQYRFISTTDKDPLRVYVYCTGTSYYPPNHSTVYRSDDGGGTWRAVLFSDPRFAQKTRYNVSDDYVTKQWKMREQCPPRSMVLSGGDPDVLAMCTSAWLLRTDDGGKSWRSCMTGPASQGDAGGQAWACNGLVVTTTWNYYIDPHQPRRHYICYTDIGMARSLDAGRTWIWQALSLPWHNTVYELAFDPAVPGRIWGAMSNQHDIPNENATGHSHRTIMQGGVARSDDYGISWKKVALPEAPALSVVLDPTSPPDRRVLYASLYEKGVYKSVDGGQTWAPASRGLGSPANMRCCKLSRSENGTLFVLITAKMIAGKYTSQGVGLYRSTDAAATWTKITGPLDLLWPKDFTVKPGDPKTILLSLAGVHGHPEDGGLYRTTDGGLSWTMLARKGREHFGAFYHPAHPGWIYMTLTEGAPEAGLYLSRDNGATWAPFSTLPFRNIQRVAFDPAHPDQIILTTFGSSILRGPAEP
jgi:photosystem II stability/assembly factor-like uncharacterized protein